MECVAGELRAVIGGDGGRQTAGGGELIEDGDGGRAADGSIDLETQALGSEIFDQSQAAEAATAGELVMEEVRAPALIESRGLRQRDARAGRELAPKGEAFLAIEPLGALNAGARELEAHGKETLGDESSHIRRCRRPTDAGAAPSVGASHSAAPMAACQDLSADASGIASS